MKQIRYILVLLLCLMGMEVMAHSYTSQSVLSSGKWIKISVTETGMHYLTYDELRQAGLNPQDLRIYGYGGARLTQDFSLAKIDDLCPVPFMIVTGADGVFGSGDYVVFYAQGLEHWDYNGSRFVHVNHPYSTKGYYFLSDDAGSQQLITTMGPPAGTPTHRVNTYTALQLHEVDSLNLIDRTGKEGGGREFYEQIPASGTMNLRFNFSGIVSSQPLKVFADFAAYSSKQSTFTFTLNNQSKTASTDGISTSDFYTMGTGNSSLFSFTPAAGVQQDLNIQFTNSANGSLGFLNYVEVAATCSLVLRDRPLPFRNVEYYGEHSHSTYMLDGADSETEVWNVSSLDYIRRVTSTLNGNTLSFNVNNQYHTEFIAFKPSMRDKFYHPTILGNVPNQNLHALQDIDMVIITNEAFLPAAQTLAAAHERIDGMTTAVVTDGQVYNEFSSGTPDATAYRWIMKMLYDRAAANSAIHAPQYLLLMGDGTFDNRKLLAASGNNWLLTYQAKNSLVETKAYASDDYFGFLDNDEGESDLTARMDIGVGRLPVNSLNEANAVVQKTIDYMESTRAGKWKSQLVFLADDGDSNQHTQDNDEAAESVRRKNLDFVVNKVYLDAYPQETSAAGESYPLAKNKFHNLLSTGVLFFDYSGHGGYNAITSESIMTLADITAMTNQNRGLWFLATCNFSSFDAGLLSAGEEAVLNPDGGAIATISACRTVYANYNKALNILFCDTLFAHASGHYRMTIGKALQYAKNKRGSD
ncbi:MAG: type IX secretion system sortase PorU, partial [Paludibacteraceae bacterium]|nr:type IX secretion system sortase PorU [Paludibacteraceae bacterium]